MCVSISTYAHDQYNSSYRQTFSIRGTESQNLNVSRLVLQSIEADCQIGNEDILGAALTADAPTTSE